MLDNNGKAYTQYDVLQSAPIKMKKINEWLYAPDDSQNKFLDEVFIGYDFGKIQQDIFGSLRIDNNSIGAINNLPSAEKFKIDKKKYGPKWFSTERIAVEPHIIKASSNDGELAKKILQAVDGDIIELSDTRYVFNTSLKINKKITLRSKNKAKLCFKGENDSIAFEMNPKGNIKLENLILKGEKGKYAFAPLKDNMS